VLTSQQLFDVAMTTGSERIPILHFSVFGLAYHPPLRSASAEPLNVAGR